MTYTISAFYAFLPLSNLEKIKSDLETKAAELKIRGLLVLGTEGINSTCAAPSEQAMNQFKQWIGEYFGKKDIVFKNSKADKAPFRRYKVKIREEIVTTGIPGVMPPEGKNHHLSPEEWNRVMKEEPNAVLIDTRNWYEYKIGSFKGALNPNIEKFTEFPEYIEKQGISKDRKMLIFCTGGIRCEKGILELQDKGYENVYQLEGGILNYLEKFPNDQFEGECFVFDHRVAVDQNLEPSKVYDLCPHCGQPGKELIACKRCDANEEICEDCLAKPFVGETCSKNCAHHWQLYPGRKGTKQVLPFELETGRVQGVQEIRITKKKVTRLNPDGVAVTIQENA